MNLEQLAWIATIFGAGIGYLTYSNSKKNKEINVNITNTIEREKTKEKIIPDGIQFGSNVLQIPYIENEFNRFPVRFNVQNKYSWIERGDTIAVINVSFPNRDIPIIKSLFGYRIRRFILRSPVSGLILHPEHRFGTNGDEFYERSTFLSRFSILLPIDEPNPEDGEYLFKEFCEYCWKYREQLFSKSSELIKGGITNEDILKKIIEKQINSSSKIVDATPSYKNYIDEARTLRPELRPYLRHL